MVGRRARPAASATRPAAASSTARATAIAALDGHPDDQQPAVQQGMHGDAGLQPLQRLLDQVDGDLEPGQLDGHAAQVLTRLGAGRPAGRPGTAAAGWWPARPGRAPSAAAMAAFQ